MYRLAAIACTAAALCFAGQTAEGATATVCRPAGTRLLLHNTQAEVFTNTSDGSLNACGLEHTDVVPLASAATFYKPPVMALSRAVIAVVVNDPNDDRPYISLTGLAPPSFHRNLFRPEERIGSIRVTSDDAIAFISCPPGVYDPGEPPTSPGPTCSHSGRWVDNVYVAAPGRALKRVAHARHLDPTSLRMNCSIVSWRQNGTRHTARYR